MYVRFSLIESTLSPECSARLRGSASHLPRPFLSVGLGTRLGLDGARTTTLRNRSVDERAVLQGLLQSWSSYISSQTVDICLYRNSTIILRSQRLGYKRAGPSGLAELEQLHVESNSECNRHIYLSSTLANSHLARDLSYL